MIDKYTHNPVAFILMASYSYYCLSKSLLTDGEYDELVKYLYTNRDKYDKHPHSHLIPKDYGSEGSGGLELKEDKYPSIVKSCTKMLLKERENNATR